MKKTALFLFVCLASSVCCVGQNLHSWTAGPLTWDDFQSAGPDHADSSATSYASFSLIRENKRVRTKGITYKYQDVTAAIVPPQSWVKPEGRTDRALRNHQQEFDILQYYATLYREDFMFYNDTLMYHFENYFDMGSKHRLSETAYLEQFRAAVETFRRTGEAGDYPVSREAFDITRYPCHIASDVSEAHFSLITVFPTGDLARIFSPSPGFSAGYGYREGKNYFSADLSLCVNGIWAGGYDALAGSRFAVRQGSYVGLSAKYGRILLSPGRTTLSLFAGLGYSAWKEGHFITPATVKGATLTEGISLDIHLHRTFNYLAKTPRVKDTAFQLKLYADQLYLAAQGIFVPTFNVAVGLNVGYRKLSRVR